MVLFKRKQEQQPTQQTQQPALPQQPVQQIQQPIVQQPVPQEVVKDKFAVVEIATQTEPRIIDTETEETYDLYTMICKIANKVDRIDKYLTNS